MQTGDGGSDQAPGGAGMDHPGGGAPEGDAAGSSPQYAYPYPGLPPGAGGQPNPASPPQPMGYPSPPGMTPGMGYPPPPGMGYPPPPGMGYPPPPGMGYPPPPGMGYPPPPGMGYPPPPGMGYPPPPGMGYPPPPGMGYPPAGYGYSGFGLPPVGSGRFRPLLFGELLDTMFQLYRRNFLLLIAIAAVVQIPYAAVSYALTQIFSISSVSSGFRTTAGTLNSAQVTSALTAVGLTVVLDVVFLLLLTPLATSATSKAISERYLDRATTVGASYRFAVRRLPSLVVAYLLEGIVFVAVVAVAFLLVLATAIGGGGLAAVLVAFLVFVILFVGIIFVEIRLGLMQTVITLERLGPLQGMARSWRLTRGFFWRNFGLTFVVGLITFGISAIIGGVVVAVILAAGSNPVTVAISDVASALISVVLDPLGFVIVVLMYYDIRIRREAFDIDMLATSL